MSLPPLSVIVPAHNAAATLPRCLTAIVRSAPAGTEIIVVDDGSTDDTAALAHDFGATIVQHDHATGPARARNAGVARASAPIVLFVDADVEIAGDAIERVLATFNQHPSPSAVFGSYDDSPAAGTLVSDYRNLLHHFVHQQANEASTSFWAGLGAIRRSALDACGGFDERYARPSIEDIELGARLSAAGHHIRLDKTVRGTHLKRWTLAGVVRTDVLARARPWTLLLLRDGSLPHDLNLKPRHRASGVLVWVPAIAAAVALVHPEWWAALTGVAIAALGGVAVLNLDFYRFLLRRRGLAFAAASFPLHALYYACASATFAWCCVEHVIRRLIERVRRSGR